MIEYYFVHFKESSHYIDLFEVNYDAKMIRPLRFKKINGKSYELESAKPIKNQLLNIACNGTDDKKTFYSVKKLQIGYGNYYPRIYRPNANDKSILLGNIVHDSKIFITPEEEYLSVNLDVLQTYIIEYKYLYEKLEDIFRYIHPSKENFHCYSNELRNFIILICTEIEAHFQAILKENGSVKIRMTTQDYYLINDLTKINKYTLTFRNFSQLGNISPFKSWKEANPTKSLSWYDYYNEIKHNKYLNLSKANLGCAVNSFAALSILILSQFNNYKIARDTINNYINIKATPKWDISECYFYSDGQWNRVKYTKKDT